MIAAHITKEERNVKMSNLMSREQIDPLVDTLLKQFGKAKSGGCFSNMSNKSARPIEPKIVPVDIDGPDTKKDVN